jgi:1,4-alpha-glucan branching enzyme
VHGLSEQLPQAASGSRACSHGGDRSGRRRDPRSSPPRRRGRAPAGGALAIVLHTHMPYVEGFGTWPFGEEWLWEAMATCYLPLLDLLDQGAPLTLSLTPVLCDQLEADGVEERFTRFVEEVRRHTHTEDARGLRAGGHERLACELERSFADYQRAARRLRQRGGDLLGAFSAHAQWTSAATHAVLPLLASDAGASAQVQAGVHAHRARFGGWGGGFWLPECAHAPAVEPILLDAGVGACCVELTDRLGLGSHAHLRPLATEAGLTLVPIDRQTISLVWSDAGYPAHGGYRDYHRHTIHHHNPWANDGGAYDHDAALGLARVHAADFVDRVRARLRSARTDTSPPGGGLVVCALDTELLGHWWYEGVAWLTAVVEECSSQGLPLLRLDEALQQCEPAPVCSADWEPSSWGRDGDLSTWSGPAVAEIAYAQRAAELRLLHLLDSDRDGAGRQTESLALRELMAMQSSDWAFMVSRDQAVPYARERFEGHRDGFEQALASHSAVGERRLRNLATYADPHILALT